MTIIFYFYLRDDENNDLTIVSSQLMNDCNVEQVTEDSSNHHDDSLPSNSPAPHPQITQVFIFRPSLCN